jgi:alpha-methylacyl-CoA racemase
MTAGHDIDYIAITGALHAIGAADEPPQIPLNVVGDIGGGGLYLVVGVLAALREVERSGVGQVVDAAIVDGSAHLLASVHAMMAMRDWTDRRGTNLFDGGAPFYAVYETADGSYMAVGAIESRFYQQLMVGLELDVDPASQYERQSWPAMRKTIAEQFGSRTQAEWTAVFESLDACVAPVLGLWAAQDHPHLAARGTLVERDGMLQAAPAPRFSRTPTALGAPPPRPGQHTRAVFADWDVPGVDDLIDRSAAREAP